MLNTLLNGLRDLPFLSRVVQVMARGISPDTPIPFVQGRSYRPIDKEASVHLLRQVGYQEMLKSRWIPRRLTLEELKSCPSCSLGHEVALHLLKRNQDPGDVQLYPHIRSEADYYLYRYRSIHDYLHILTGFDTDWLGEVGLMAFDFAQMRSRKQAFYLFGAMLYAVCRDEAEQSLIVKAIYHGLAMGSNAKCVIAHKVEEHLTEPINDVQRWLNIKPLIKPE